MNYGKFKDILNKFSKNEIINLLGVNDSGLLDKQLKNLISMETIEKIFPINKRAKRNLYV